MSLNPNPALLTNEYEKIAEVPWGSRTRLYIDLIEAIYEPMPASARRSRPPATTGAELIGQSFTPETFFNEAGGPRFVITIQGRTPSDTATADLAQFVRWFEQNSERPDRPYKLFASQQTSIISLGAAEPAGEVADRPGAPGSPGTGLEGSGSRFGPPRALPGSTPRRPRFGGPRAGSFDEPGIGPGGGGGGGPATFSIDELIPRRPRREYRWVGPPVHAADRARAPPAGPVAAVGNRPADLSQPGAGSTRDRSSSSPHARPRPRGSGSGWTLGRGRAGGRGRTGRRRRHR